MKIKSIEITNGDIERLFESFKTNFNKGLEKITNYEKEIIISVPGNDYSVMLNCTIISHYSHELESLDNIERFEVCGLDINCYNAETGNEIKCEHEYLDESQIEQYLYNLYEEMQ